MPHLQDEAIQAMTKAFRQMEASITPPQKVAHGDSFVFRYASKGIHEAILQKLARMISGLNAIQVLLNAGYVQEVGVLCRTLDEINEDILFLATAAISGEFTKRHTQYLEAFYAESIYSRVEGTFDIPKPNLVPRRKIRAHTASSLGKGADIYQSIAAGEALNTAYSGFVHASSEVVMSMYGGLPPHYHLAGMRGTTQMTIYERDVQNYVYRGTMTTIVAAKAFGDAPLVELLEKFLAKFESANYPEAASAKDDTLED
jgi:hypothetical protein